MASFSGNSTQKIDGKGRVSIPAMHRSVVEVEDDRWDSIKGGTCQIVYGDHLRGDFVEIYTREEFERITRKIGKMKRSDPRREAMQFMVVGQSAPVAVDPAGRMILPKPVRDKLGVGPDGAALKFMGKVDKIDVRIDEKSEDVRQKNVEWLESMGEDFDLMAGLDDVEDDE